eukprot:TRINITY_DN1592_c0_g1_i2.p2 TRINITY_DN1592_c0_g1~~TRINITY_DN1592_c0_g1_i2.p2  ORF type:complete len:408 (+),score=43.54 TRINITY_DN1592_c0_g1_i2:3111-4334(+)
MFKGFCTSIFNQFNLWIEFIDNVMHQYRQSLNMNKSTKMHTFNKPMLMRINSDTEDSICGLSAVPVEVTESFQTVSDTEEVMGEICEALSEIMKIAGICLISKDKPTREMVEALALLKEEVVRHKEHEDKLVSKLKAKKMELLKLKTTITETDRTNKELQEKDELLKKIAKKAENMANATQELQAQHEEVLQKLAKADHEYNAVVNKCKNLEAENQRLKQEIANLNKVVSDLNTKLSITKATPRHDQAYETLKEIMNIFKIEGSYADLLSSLTKIEQAIKVVPKIQCFVKEVHIALENAVPQYDNAVEAINGLLQKSRELEQIKLKLSEGLGLEDAENIVPTILEVFLQLRLECELYHKVLFNQEIIKKQGCKYYMDTYGLESIEEMNGHIDRQFLVIRDVENLIYV